jgi:hypothetical protein
MSHALFIVSLFALAACGSPSNAEPASPSIDPSQFVATIDNPYLPFLPGTVWSYRGTSDEGPEADVVTVTPDTKNVLGVTAVVVHDVVSRDGEVTEDTYDWYAQDKAGNVWYLGEDTKELENGKVVSTEGSWEAGRDGARAGIVMKAHPKVGEDYAQEYYPGKAEDRATVVALDAQATVPFGSFDHVVETKDYSRLEPEIVEHKYFARGIGSVLEVTVKGGKDRLELIEMHRPS